MAETFSTTEQIMTDAFIHSVKEGILKQLYEEELLTSEQFYELSKLQN